ncbi:MAG: LytR C-terminal domain-containing protein [Acidimicrobiia bacterium]|nr:LytR C-terminal domain-containing protein [Acidimicrobiia bacterium]
MTNEDPTGGQGTRRSPRQGVGGSPVGSTLSIVLAVVAVIAGFLILRNITDDNDSGGVASDGASGEAVDVVSTTIDPIGSTTIAPTTTVFTPVTEGATVVVANANTVGGSAGRMTKTLEAAGFTMGDPVNAGETLDESIVYYDTSVAAARAVAESVGVLLGGLVVEAVPTPPPTDDGTMGDGSVLLMLGNNEADKTIEELTAADDTTSTGTSPDPSGSPEVAPTSTTG